MKANIVNHEVIILDASSSMQMHTSNVVKVTDALIQQLASQVSLHPDQETRITVYAFSSENYLDGRAYQCLIWDKDVLRVPSIAGLYKPHGNTALIAMTMQVIEDINRNNMTAAVARVAPTRAKQRSLPAQTDEDVAAATRRLAGGVLPGERKKRRINLGE